jgi:hypothetical protein
VKALSLTNLLSTNKTIVRGRFTYEKFTFTTGEFKEEKISAWLAGFIKFTQTIGAFDLLEQVKVKMKVIDYTIHQKIITLLLSIVIGCRYTSDINHKLDQTL